jgi:hypothetical protein
MMMEAVGSFETLVNIPIYQNTRRNIPEDSYLHEAGLLKRYSAL